MKLTNKLNLPEPIVNAVANDSYSRGDASISVTSLLAPPRIITLQEKHADEIEEDASERIWSLMGQVVHGILERADTTGVAERRLTIAVEGWTISGQMDRYIDGVLQDYKVVTAYKFKDGGVPIEYEQQLNVYAHLLRENGHPVTKLQIVGILRDWSKMEAARDPEYPQRQVVVRAVKLWDEETTKKFIRTRVILHQQARIRLPECSMEDRWAKPTKYAVMKKGAVKATKLYEVERDAQADAEARGKDYSVEKRLAENTRCRFYCSVSKFCSQYQALLTPEEARKESEEVA